VKPTQEHIQFVRHQPHDYFNALCSAFILLSAIEVACNRFTIAGDFNSTQQAVLILPLNWDWDKRNQ